MGVTLTDPVEGHIGKRTWGRIWPPLLLAAAVSAAYSNSFGGVFLFDDVFHIVENERLRQWWPPWHLLAVERPVVELSLAVNYALGELDPRGYHAFNLLVHVFAALALFGVVRRTLILHHNPGRRARGPSQPDGLPAAALPALAVALLWAVHPLQTQSVTYVIQRGEALMGMFYLLTLYCAIRGSHSTRRPGWYGSAIVACGLGMGSKAIMVTAPITVFIYDFVFRPKPKNGVSAAQEIQPDSFRRISSGRWALYGGLAATWSVLWLCGVAPGVLDSAASGSHVGFGYRGVTPLEYAGTQPGVILKYLTLAFRPAGLCLDYDWRVAADFDGVVLPTMFILALLAGTAWGIIRRSWSGFAGAWFFIILAPTSSFIPIKDAAFEHRMYLPLAGLIAVVVFGAGTLLNDSLFRLSMSPIAIRRTKIAVTVAIAMLLSFGTYQRNKVYQSGLAMWADVVRKRPENARARLALGNALLERNRSDEAIAAFREALAIRPDWAEGHCALGMGLARKGILEDAVTAYRASLRLDPNLAKAHYNLGNALSRQGRIDEAIRSFRDGLRIQPRFAEARCNLGNAFAAKGLFAEAVNEYREALRIKPSLANAVKGLGDALVQLGRVEEGIAALREALRIQPEYANAHAALAAALFDRGEYDEALRHAQEALRLAPAHDAAGETLLKSQAALERLSRP